MIEKIISIALAMISAAAMVSAKDYHVGAGHSLKTISAAAELAQPGDTIMVHEGIYREEINPPRGGLSGAQLLIEVFDYQGPHESGLWFGEVDDTNTTIYTQFKDLDPNERGSEINVRRTVFYPREPGRNYIMVHGFTIMHTATPWAPPTAEQVGLIRTHWSKGWIIENNTISHSKCVGITLGKYGDEWDNRSATATTYNDTIERAQGTRVSGNLFYNNFDENVCIKVNHGAYCYNILPGAITMSPQMRETPYHRPHTTEVLVLSSISGGDGRYINNLMTQPDPFGAIQKIKHRVVEGNSPVQSAKILEKNDGVYLIFEIPAMDPTRPVTAERLGKNQGLAQAIEQFTI